jgi:hypothetical protein
VRNPDHGRRAAGGGGPEASRGLMMPGPSAQEGAALIPAGITF